GDLAVRLEQLPVIWNKFEKQQTALEEECQEDELKKYTKDRVDFETKYFQTKALYMTQVTSQPSHNETKPHPTDAPVRLPTLDLPKFNGDYTGWISFSDIFQVAVHNNTALKDVQRLQYLRSCLEGEALGIIESLPVTELNYKEAWK